MTGVWGEPTFARWATNPCPTAARLADVGIPKTRDVTAHPCPTRETLEQPPDYAVSAHAEAAARLLCAVVRQLRTGTPPEELGAQVVALGEMMERRI